VKTTDIIDTIDARVAEKSLLRHPFYQAWTRGELSQEALADYATQYYHHVAAFPTYLSSLHAHTEDLSTRRHILANLMDEEAGNPNHPELWLQFAEALGVSREDVLSAELWPETKNLIQAFRSVCGGGSVAEGLAALYAYESQIPQVAESKIKGLETFYGLNDSKALGYFQVHIEADKEHSRVERQLLKSTLDPENASEVNSAVDIVLDRLWDLLSAVCERHAIAC
jgi:pyrroloquinoline-quinone synthase